MIAQIASMAVELALILTEAACEAFLAWRLGAVS